MARNTNRQGANFELTVMHYLDGCACEVSLKAPKHQGWRGFGYDSARSSGSRGKVDVFSIGPLRHYEAGASPDAELLLVQCKITNPLISPADRRALRDLAERAGALPLVAYSGKDATTGRVRPHFRLLTGLGPHDWVPWEPGKDT
jgi:hypothetical protein